MRMRCGLVSLMHQEKVHAGQHTWNVCVCACVCVSLTHYKVRLMNVLGARQGRSVSVTPTVPLLLARGTRCGSSVVATTKLFIYDFSLLLSQVQCVCVDLPMSSAAGVSFVRDKAGKSLQLSHWSSLEIGRNIIKMKRGCVHRRERPVPQNVEVSSQELRTKVSINSYAWFSFLFFALSPFWELGHPSVDTSKLVSLLHKVQTGFACTTLSKCHSKWTASVFAVVMGSACSFTTI